MVGHRGRGPLAGARQVRSPVAARRQRNWRKSRPRGWEGVRRVASWPRALPAPPFAPPLPAPFAPPAFPRNCETTRFRRPLSCCSSCIFCALLSSFTSHVMSETASSFCSQRDRGACERRV